MRLLLRELLADLRLRLLGQKFYRGISFSMVIPPVGIDPLFPHFGNPKTRRRQTKLSSPSPLLHGPSPPPNLPNEGVVISVAASRFTREHWVTVDYTLKAFHLRLLHCTTLSVVPPSSIAGTAAAEPRSRRGGSLAQHHRRRSTTSKHSGVFDEISKLQDHTKLKDKKCKGLNDKEVWN
ncbi:hypothetical protein PIB30_080977 [Stylosanthes scabra]|uniref:Uncharacterized protein n=1 Tax=Stylosanthes scabra TaxID=79078 RepID=A0ABU6XSJ5_9FABA|nr:hypothetical protein [Stylosanthes scabra]